MDNMTRAGIIQAAQANWVQIREMQDQMQSKLYPDINQPAPESIKDVEVIDITDRIPKQLPE